MLVQLDKSYSLLFLLIEYFAALDDVFVVRQIFLQRLFFHRRSLFNLRLDFCLNFGFLLLLFYLLSHVVEYMIYKIKYEYLEFR